MAEVFFKLTLLGTLHSFDMSKCFLSSWNQSCFSFLQFSVILKFFIKSVIVTISTFLRCLTNYCGISVLKKKSEFYFWVTKFFGCTGKLYLMDCCLAILYILICWKFGKPVSQCSWKTYSLADLSTKRPRLNFLFKVENILKGSLYLIPSPSLKIQIMGRKVYLRCKSKTLLDVLN